MTILILADVVKSVTGKRVVQSYDRRQFNDRIHADAFQDLLHEFAHWLAAKDEHRTMPNLAFSEVEESDTSELAIVEEYYAIAMHKHLYNSTHIKRYGTSKDDAYVNDYLPGAIEKVIRDLYPDSVPSAADINSRINERLSFFPELNSQINSIYRDSAKNADKQLKMEEAKKDSASETQSMLDKLSGVAKDEAIKYLQNK